MATTNPAAEPEPEPPVGQFQSVPPWLKAYFVMFAKRDAEGITGSYVEGDVQYHVHKDAYPLLPPPLSCLRLCGCCMPQISKAKQAVDIGPEAVKSLAANYDHASFERLMVAAVPDGPGCIVHYALKRYDQSGAQIQDGGFFVYKIKEMVSGAGDWKICEVYMCGLSEEVPESFQELLGWSSLSFVDMGKEAVFCKPEEGGST